MSLTPNYGFNIPTGTDAVNLLTQNYPNFTSLDSILKTIELTGITTATVSKVGTVFQVVRTNSALNVIRFVATGNYVAGDTFTIDGVAVTATAVDGSSIPGGAFVINQSVMAILNGSVLTVLVSSGASTASGITYDNTGSGLAATNVQDAIDELEADIPTIPATYDADDIVYDNTGSGLTAIDVQAAIDEVVLMITTGESVTLAPTAGEKWNSYLGRLFNVIDFTKVTPKAIAVTSGGNIYQLTYTTTGNVTFVCTYISGTSLFTKMISIQSTPVVRTILGGTFAEVTATENAEQLTIYY